MKVLTNPGLVLGSFLVGVAIVGIIWLSMSWQIQPVIPPADKEGLSVHEKCVITIAEARRLAEDSQYQAASDLLSREAKRLSAELVAEPALVALELHGTMLLEAAKIAEKSLGSLSTNADKRRVATQYLMTSQLVATGAALAAEFRVQGIKISDIDLLLSRYEQIKKEALESFERLAPKRAKDEVDLIPFPSFPNW